MNLFNEAIYSSHLEHSLKGQTWGKHKYLYITETGRYVYPEDVAKGKTQQQFRSRQINDQIKSAHQGSQPKSVKYGSTEYYVNNSKGYNSMGRKGTTLNTISSMDYQKKLKESTAKTSGAAAGTNKVSTPAERNTITIKKTTTTTPKTEEKKTEKANSSKASTATEESKKMGLSDDDLKKMEVNTQATDREEVLKNIALRVIRGDYGNGNDRKAKLGDYYDEVQNRVNELMKSGQIQREGQAAQKSQNTEQKTPANTTKSSTEKTETQKKNAEEISVAKQLAEISGMKNSATLNLVKMYKQDSKSKKFQEELDSLAEGDEKQRQRMLRILGYMKHSDLEEGNFLMHWGKKRRSGRFKFGSGNRPYQHEAGHTRKNSTFHDRRTMSDEELQKSIDRVRKEVELYRAERDNRSQGQRFVEDVLTSIGKDVLKTAGRGALLWAGKNYATKVLKNEELGDFIARGGAPKKDKNK